MGKEGLKDNVLTLLIHLGYLGYDFREQSVFIPNSEIRREFLKLSIFSTMMKMH